MNRSDLKKFNRTFFTFGVVQITAKLKVSSWETSHYALSQRAEQPLQTPFTRQSWAMFPCFLLYPQKCTLLVLSLLRALKPTNQQIYNDQVIHRKINAVSLLLFSTGIDSAYYKKLVDAEPFGHHLGCLATITKKTPTNLQLHYCLICGNTLNAFKQPPEDMFPVKFCPCPVIFCESCCPRPYPYHRQFCTFLW